MQESNNMEDKFDLSAIEKTFTSYKKGTMFDGVVVMKRDDGVIFNIGGKNDAFIDKEDFDDYESVKIGDRFKVMIVSRNNEEGMIEVSKRKADELVKANQNASKLKLGSTFSFVVTNSSKDGLHSKMGEYSIFIPAQEVGGHTQDLRKLEGKQFDATVTEIDKDNKSIVGSIKLLQQQIQQTNENLFWSSIFPNKIVSGKVKKILPYGAFIDVGGVDCFVHISNISHSRLEKVEDALHEGQEVTAKVIELDRENKKVSLSIKALEKSPKKKAIEELVVGNTYSGKVVKILKFGAIIKLDNGASGLLHISNATTDNQKQIYEIVKLDEEVQVQVLDKNEEEERVSFSLAKKEDE